MRIRQGPEQNSVELRSGTATGAKTILGLGLGVFGFLFSATVTSSIFFAHRAAERMPTPWWILFVPVLFLAFGISFAGSGKRVRTLLRRYGESRTLVSSWFGLKKEETTFDAAHGHHLSLHTDERISRSKNGTTRYRVSTLALVTRDGAEVIIGKQQRTGLGGNQPLLEQAAEISLFLGLPLERTGYGAPIGYDPQPPGGVAGPPPGYGSPPGYGPPGGMANPPQMGGHQQPPGPQGAGGRNPGEGEGLPGWVRGQGH